METLANVAHIVTDYSNGTTLLDRIEPVTPLDGYKSKYFYFVHPKWYHKLFRFIRGIFYDEVIFEDMVGLRIKRSLIKKMIGYKDFNY
jgi:hypothetical protein